MVSDVFVVCNVELVTGSGGGLVLLWLKHCLLLFLHFCKSGFCFGSIAILVSEQSGSGGPLCRKCTW